MAKNGDMKDFEVASNHTEELKSSNYVYFVMPRSYINRIKLLKQDVTQQQAVFDKVMQDGHAMLNGTSHGPGRDELKSRLDNSKKRWEEVKQDTDDRSAKIDELHPKSKSFFDSSVTFSCWLMKAETVKASILDANLFADKDMIKQRGLDLQNFKEDLNQNYPTYQNMESNGTQLVNKCNELNVSNGVDHIDGEMRDLNDRYSSLNAFADKERERILEIGRQLDECQIQLTPIEDLIRLARRTLDEQALFDDDRDQGRKLIDDIENLKRDFDKEEPNLERIYIQFPKLLKELGIKVDPVEERFKKVKDDFYRTRTDLQAFSELINKQVSEADNFRRILDDLKDWIPKMKAKATDVKPIDGDRNDIQKQLQEIQECEAEIVQHKPSLETAKASASLLTELNKGNPRACSAINDRLNEVSYPLADLMTYLEERLKKLEKTDELVRKYEEDKRPFEEFINATNVDMEEKEPFGLDEEEGKRRIEQLNELVDNLDKKKHDLRTINKSGQILIRNIDSQDKIEIELDKISDSYYLIFDKVKDKRDETKATLAKVTQLLQIVIEIEIWIEEVYVIIEKIGHPTTDSSTIKSHLEEIQVVRVDLSKYLPKLGLVSEVTQQLIQINLENPASVEAINLRVDKVKKPMEEEIPNTLSQLEEALQASLSSNLKFQDEADGLMRWLNQIEVALKSQSPLSADENIANRQKSEHAYLTDDIARNKQKFDAILSTGNFDETDGSMPSEAARELVQLKEKWENVNEAAKDRTDALEEVLPMAAQFQSDKANICEWLKSVRPKVEDLEVISVDEEKLKAQEETSKELRLDMESHRPEFDKLNETGKCLVDKCDADIDPVEETLTEVKRDWDDIEARLKKATDQVDEMKGALENLDAELKPGDDVCTKVEQGMQESAKFGTDAEAGEKELNRLEELLKELNDEEPHLEHAHALANKAVSVCSDAENVAAMKRRIDAEDLRFNELKELLGKEVDSTEKAVDNAKKFNEKMGEVGTRVEALKGKLDRPFEVGASADKVKEGLVEVEELQVEANAINEVCSEASVYGDDIIDFSKLPEVEEDIHVQIKSARQPLADMIDQLDSREQMLKQQLQQTGQFQDQFEDFERRLKNFDGKVNEIKELPVSTKSAKIGVMMENLETLAKDLGQEDPVYDGIIQSGNDMLDKIDSEQEKQKLKGKLDDLTIVWKKAHEDLEQRRTRLNEVYDKAKSREDDEGELDTWLDVTEKKLKDLKPLSCVPNELDAQKKELNALNSELVNRQPQFEKITLQTEDLKNVCQEDIEEMTSEFEETEKNLNDVSKLLAGRQNDVDHMDTKLMEFDMKEKYCNEAIGKLKKALDSEIVSGVGSEKLQEGKDNLDKIKKKIDDLKSSVEMVESISDELESRHVNSDISSIKNRAEVTRDDYEKLQKAAEEKLADVDTAVKELEDVEKRANEMADKLGKAARKLDENRPKKMVFEELIAQAEAVKDVEAEMDELKPTINEILRDGNQLLKNGFGDEKLSNDLASINGNRRKCVDEAPVLEKDLENLANDCKKLNDGISDVGSKLDAIEDKKNALKSIGTDADAIKEQMEEVKALRDEIAELQSTTGDLTDLRDELVKGNPDCDSSNLDESINHMNNRLMDCNQKLSDRQGKLEEALVQCGQFSDAAESILQWLEETRDLIEGQGPISAADPNVLKAQIMEQKLLAKMFDDRAPSFNSVQNIGHDILASQPDGDSAAKTKEDLDKVTELWNVLSNAVEERKSKLDSLLPVSQRFIAKFDEASKRLAEIDKNLDDEKWIPLGTAEDVEKQIDDMKALEKDVDDAEPVVEEAVAAAQELMAQCSPDDVEILQRKMDSLSQDSEKLKDKRDRKLSTLNDTAELLKNFYNQDKELKGFFVDASKKLEEKSDESTVDIMGLQKEIAAQRPNIAKLVEMEKKLEKVVVPSDFVKIKEASLNDQEEYARLKQLADNEARGVFMAKEKVDDFNNAFDELSVWLNDVRDRHGKLDAVAVDAEIVKEQLKEHQEFLVEIAARDAQFKNLYAESERLIAASNEDEETALKEKMQSLEHRRGHLNDTTSQRQTNLIEALVLAQQFSDTVKEVTNRLTATEGILEKIDADKSKGIEVQKEKLKDLQDGMDQLSPLMDAVKETGDDLIRLSGPGAGADHVTDQVKSLEERWNKLSQRVQEKGISIHKAADRVEEVQAKTDETMSQLQGLKSRLKALEPVAVYEEPILKQCEEHKMTEEEISAMEEPASKIIASIDHVCEEDANSPISVNLKERQRKITNLMTFLKNASESRRKSLEDSLEASRKFWPGIDKLQTTLQEVKTKIDTEDEPRLDPAAIQELQQEHEIVRKDLDSNEDLINVLCHASPVLVGNASQDDKVDVHKQLTDITEQWDAIESAWSKRKSELEQTYEIAVQYKSEVESIENWLTEEEVKFANMPAVGSNVGEVKKQLADMRETYKNLTLKQMEITALSQKGQSLSERVESDEADKIFEKVDEVKERWEKLCNMCNDMQQRLEEALFDLGQYSIAMEELLTWIEQTKSVLHEKEAPPREKKIVEVEMAKLKVIRSDVKAHEPSIVICRNSASKIINSSDDPKEKERLHGKLDELNAGWDEIEVLLAERLKRLEEALDESKNFQNQVREMIGWLNEAKAFLRGKRPTGGKPETAMAQVEKHKEFLKVVEERHYIFEYITETLETLITQSSSISSSRVLEKTLDEVKKSWEAVSSLADNQKLRLDTSLEMTVSFSDMTSEITVWLTSVEDICKEFDPPAILPDKLELQVTSLKVLQDDIDKHRPEVAKMKDLVMKITETCTSDEAYALNNDMRFVDVKFKQINTELKHRKKSLEENKELAANFFDSAEKLILELNDLENSVKEDLSVGKDKAMVKAQMKRFKEQQLRLNLLQPKLIYVLKNGSMLQNKGVPEESAIVEERKNEIKAQWDELCKMLVGRQRQLEEALLFHGMFQDAVQALEEWLSNVEPVLTTGTAVMGDVDTIKLLMDQHKRFVTDLNSRKLNFDKIMSVGEQTIKEGHVQDPTALQSKLDELRLRWDAVISMSTTKQGRLQNALEIAKEFQLGTRNCLKRIADFLDILKSQGPVSEDHEGIKKQVEEFEKFQKDIDAEEVNVNKVLRQGEVILRFCHPNALQIIRHQIALLKRRWLDVTTWAKQRQTRLREADEVLIEEETLVDELMTWIVTEEEALVEVESIPLPDDYDALFAMLEEHKKRQGKATAKQPDYDKILKNAKKSSPDKRRSVRTPGRAHHDCQPKEFVNPRVTQLSKKWQQLWLNLMERMKKLQKKLDDIRIKKASAEFDWDAWKARYKHWLQETKSRVPDLWRRKDQNKDNKLSRQEFVEGILETNFVTERWETELVFNMFEKGGQLAYKDFFDALKDKKEPKMKKPKTVSEQLQFQIETESAKCCCPHKFQSVRIGEGKEGDLYYNFGESQKKYLVRILRSNVMVRVGGGWMSLVEFLGKYDPCRAEGKMNYQIRDSLYLPEGASLSMLSFKTKRESSSTKLKPRAVSREPSGELKGTLSPPRSSGYGVTRQKSDVEKRRNGKQPTCQVHGDSPQLSRQKSDSGRASVKTPDYSNVRGSGYGGTRTKREQLSGSLKGDEHRRSTPRLSVEGKDVADGKTRLKREKSGDLLGKASPSSTSLKKSTSREEVKAQETPGPSTKPRTGSASKKARTPSVEEGGTKGSDVAGATAPSGAVTTKKAETPKSAGSQKSKQEGRRSTEASKSTKTTRKSAPPASKSSTKK